ncbi:hypothetical protein NoPa_00094 [Pseudomonas phage vB_PpuM-NoPa]|uniref:Uncharacterized protein n=1 Tax=Pseudomonas phage vB_PpuM-NoPa TaxID=3132619 RepID=A0AAX4MXH6_9CAUD
MQLFFASRTKARSFAQNTGRKVVDKGVQASKRWAVAVKKQK